jgi:hypothetical protein
VSDSLWERWGPLAGIAFVVLFIAGFFLLNIPTADDSVGKVVSFYNDSGDRAQLIISSYLLWLAGLFFFWFVASLRARLIAVEGMPGRLTSIAFGGGLVFIALLMAGAACFASIAGDITFGGDDFDGVKGTFLVGARFIPELGFPLILIGGAFAAIAMLDAVSLLIVRTGFLPKWIGYFGFVAAVGLLFAGFFIPIVLFLLWVIFASVAMWRTAPPAPVPASPPATPPPVTPPPA